MSNEQSSWPQPEHCPFCDSKETHAQDIMTISPETGHYWVVKCEGCGAQGPKAEGVIDAVMAWNAVARKAGKPEEPRKISPRILEQAAEQLRSITFSDDDSNAERYYRGFNDGHERALQQMEAARNWQLVLEDVIYGDIGYLELPTSLRIVDGHQLIIDDSVNTINFMLPPDIRIFQRAEPKYHTADESNLQTMSLPAEEPREISPHILEKAAESLSSMPYPDPDRIDDLISLDWSGYPGMRWAAANRNGEIRVFGHQPFPRDGMGAWRNETEGWGRPTGLMYLTFPEGISWRDTLIKRDIGEG